MNVTTSASRLGASPDFVKNPPQISGGHDQSPRLSGHCCPCSGLSRHISAQAAGIAAGLWRPSLRAGRSRKRKPPAPGRGRATFRSKHEQLFRPVPGRGVAGARENPGGISEKCRAARRRGRAGWAGQGAARRTGRARRQRPGLQGRGETVMHPGGSSLGAAQVMAMRRARVRMSANSGGDKAGACRGNVRLREFPRPPAGAGA